MLLDAEFAATGVTAVQRWTSCRPEDQTTVHALWDAFPPTGATGALPSGVGTAGGRLHGYSDVTP